MAEQQASWAGPAVSKAWERNRERLFEAQRAVSEWLVEHLHPEPGHTVVDLACGPGETGFLVAERIGHDGRLISTDFDEHMVAAARRGIEAAGLGNAEARQMDAMAIDLDDESVDGVVSRFGLMLMPDPAAVLSGVARILRPGGRLAYGVWTGPEANPWTAVLRQALGQLGIEVPGDPYGPGGMYSLAEESTNAALVEGAGLDLDVVEPVPGDLRYESFDDYWGLHSQISGPFSTFVADLDERARADLADAVREVLQPFRSGDGYRIPSEALCVAAARTRR